MSDEEEKNKIRQLTRLQRRVLGTLMEKGFTTPDQYPMIEGCCNGLQSEEQSRSGDGILRSGSCGRT